MILIARSINDDRMVIGVDIGADVVEELVARNGTLYWMNRGLWGRLTGDRLALAWHEFDNARELARMGRDTLQEEARVIRWDQFDELPIGYGRNFERQHPPILSQRLHDLWQITSSTKKTGQGKPGPTGDRSRSDDPVH